MGRPKKVAKKPKRAYGEGSLFKIGKVWYLRYMHNGRRVKKSMKTEDFDEAQERANSEILPLKTKDEIEQLEIVKAKIATKEKVLKDEEYSKRKVKWDLIVETYFKRGFSDGCSEGTRTLYEYSFGRLWDWAKAKKYKLEWIDDFTITMAEEFRQHMSDTLSSRTYNNSLNQLKWLWKSLEAKVNVWERFKPRPVETHTKRDFTEDEIQTILNHLKTGRKHKANEEFYLLILLGIYTGLRLSDCCKMMWKSIDFTSNVISLVPQKTKKTGRDVNIPIFGVLREELLKQKEKKLDEVYVMPYIKHQYECRSIGARIRQLFVDCGLKTCERSGDSHKYKSILGFHSFRYTFTKIMSKLHCPQNQVQKMLGHSTPKMTSRYYKDDIDVAKRYVSALPQFDGNEHEEQITVFLDKSLVSEIESRKGSMTTTAYIRNLMRLESRTVDILDAQSKMLEQKKKESEELDKLLDEVLGNGHE